MNFAGFDDYPIYERETSEDEPASAGVRRNIRSHGCRFCENETDCYNCTAYCNR